MHSITFWNGKQKHFGFPLCNITHPFLLLFRSPNFLPFGFPNHFFAPQIMTSIFPSFMIFTQEFFAWNSHFYPIRNLKWNNTYRSKVNHHCCRYCFLLISFHEWSDFSLPFLRIKVNKKKSKKSKKTKKRRKRLTQTFFQSSTFTSFHTARFSSTQIGLLIFWRKKNEKKKQKKNKRHTQKVNYDICPWDLNILSASFLLSWTKVSNSFWTQVKKKKNRTENEERHLNLILSV